MQHELGPSYLPDGSSKSPPFSALDAVIVPRSISPPFPPNSAPAASISSSNMKKKSTNKSHKHGDGKKSLPGPRLDSARTESSAQRSIGSSSAASGSAPGERISTEIGIESANSVHDGLSSQPKSITGNKPLMRTYAPETSSAPRAGVSPQDPPPTDPDEEFIVLPSVTKTYEPPDEIELSASLLPSGQPAIRDPNSNPSDLRPGSAPLPRDEMSQILSGASQLILPSTQSPALNQHTDVHPSPMHTFASSGPTPLQPSSFPSSLPIITAKPVPAQAADIVPGMYYSANGRLFLGMNDVHGVGFLSPILPNDFVPVGTTLPASISSPPSIPSKSTLPPAPLDAQVVPATSVHSAPSPDPSKDITDHAHPHPNSLPADDIPPMPQRGRDPRPARRSRKPQSHSSPPRPSLDPLMDRHSAKRDHPISRSPTPSRTVRARSPSSSITPKRLRDDLNTTPVKQAPPKKIKQAGDRSASPCPSMDTTPAAPDPKTNRVESVSPEPAVDVTNNIVFVASPTHINLQLFIESLMRLDNISIGAIRKQSNTVIKVTLPTKIDLQRFLREEENLQKSFPKLSIHLESPAGSTRPPPRATLQVIARSVPHDLSDEFILSQLKRSIPEVVTARRITNFNTQAPTTFIRITLSSETRAAAALEHGVTIGFSSYKCEKPNNKPGGTRCSNCQRIGHPTRTCSSVPICTYCALHHQGGRCVARRPRCVNCGLEHPSNDNRCPAWIDHVTRVREDFERRRNPPSNLPFVPATQAPGSHYERPREPSHPLSRPNRQTHPQAQAGAARETQRAPPSEPLISQRPTSPQVRHPPGTLYSRVAAGNGRTAAPPQNQSLGPPLNIEKQLERAESSISQMVDDAIGKLTRFLDGAVERCLQRLEETTSSMASRLEETQAKLSNVSHRELQARILEVQEVVEVPALVAELEGSPHGVVIKEFARHIDRLERRFDDTVRAFEIKAFKRFSDIEKTMKEAGITANTDDDSDDDNDTDNND